MTATNENKYGLASIVTTTVFQQKHYEQKYIYKFTFLLRWQLVRLDQKQMPCQCYWLVPNETKVVATHIHFLLGKTIVQVHSSVTMHHLKAPCTQILLENIHLFYITFKWGLFGLYVVTHWSMVSWLDSLLKLLSLAFDDLGNYN